MSVDPEDLCRVTVVGVRTRFDMALPTGVPLAYLLPTLLRQAGEGLADAGASHGGWALQRLGGWPLDTGKTAAALGIADGEVLYLRPRRAELPPPVFDDVVEAIGTTLAERTGRWSAGATRTAALSATGVLLGTGLVLLPLCGPPWHPVAAVAGLVALVLLVAAAVLSRALGDAGPATLAGCAAVPYAFLAGVAGTRPGGGAHVALLAGSGSPAPLAGASAAAIALVLALGAVGGGEPGLIGAGTVTAITFLASLAAPHATVSGAAALAIGLVFVTAPVVPRVAYRMARLPTPFLPTTAEELRRADTTLPATRLSERALLADAYVTALVAGGAVVVAGAVPLLLRASGPGPVALAVAAALLALLRARAYGGRAPRVWLLGAALAAGSGAALVAATHVSGRTGRVVVVGALVVLALVTATVAARPERAPSPPRARALDIAEVAVAVATVPLVLWVLGVYSYVRSLAG